MEDKCPCENCICIPICHSKEYTSLIDQCSLVTKYLIEPRDRTVRPIKRLQKVKELLNPVFWNYEIETHNKTRKKYS